MDMRQIGTVARLWRYPVKSMRGEQLATAVLDGAGMAGDRRFALVSTAAPAGKPLLSGRERSAMLRYTASLEPRASVLTPSGKRLSLPSPELTATLQDELAAPDAQLTLRHSPNQPLTDVRPLAFISEATLQWLTRELGGAFTEQRLRCNLVLQLDHAEPFAEERLTGAHLQLGSGPANPVLRVLERVPRCRMVTLDPYTAEADPALLRYLERHRQGRVAMYAAVNVAGSLRTGAAVHVLPASL